VTRYTGDNSGTWGNYDRLNYPAGTTFTLVSRSWSAAQVMVWNVSTSVTYLNAINASYTAPTTQDYSVGFFSSTANSPSQWVDVRICTGGGGAATNTPTHTTTAATPTFTPTFTPTATAAACPVTRYTGDNSGSWGNYDRVNYPAGTTFTLVSRSSSAAQAMVWNVSSSITYLNSINASYTASTTQDYSVGFFSSTNNAPTQWVDIRICQP
jgi:hypothetical protein